MGYILTEDQLAIVDAAEKICENFPLEYWLKKERDHEFPYEFFQAVADGGWLGICMPEAFGGANLGVTEAALFLRTVAECGGQAAASTIHMNIFGLQPVVHFGTEDQKQRWLPPFTKGEVKACFAVTEPDTGLDTTKLKVVAKKQPNGDYLISGKKVFISTAQQADHMLILARTTPIDEVKKHSEGLSLFYTKLDRDYVDIREIDKLGRAAVDTNELFIDNLPVSKDSLIGEEGKGLKYIFHGMNAERVFVAAEQVGIGRAVLRLATQYAKDRVVFGRPIGQNQGVQFPIAEAFIEVEAANLMRFKAAALYDADQPCGAEANMAKYLAAKASWEAANACIQFHGGFGFANEYDVERKFRETRLYQVAPISTNMILGYVGQHILGMPKSY